MATHSVWRTEVRSPEEAEDPAREMRLIEASLDIGSANKEDLTRWIGELARYESRVRELQNNLLYRLGQRSAEQDFIEREIRALMAEFGAEQYDIPPEFVSQVYSFIRQFQVNDRERMAHVLGAARKELNVVRGILKQNHLPPDLAYMALVESGFLPDPVSSKGATGLWQFTETTARECGMEVSEELDQRLDPLESTRAASRYIRQLILDFGSGSSVMLALAAYNAGPERVRRAFQGVRDPIRERNFWHLYRTRALPEETCRYVPKVVAAIIIGRHPARFGFAG